MNKLISFLNRLRNLVGCTFKDKKYLQLKIESLDGAKHSVKAFFLPYPKVTIQRHIKNHTLQGVALNNLKVDLLNI